MCVFSKYSISARSHKRLNASRGTARRSMAGFNCPSWSVGGFAVFYTVGEAAGIPRDVIACRRLFHFRSGRWLRLWRGRRRLFQQCGDHRGIPSHQHQRDVTGRSGRLHPVQVRMRCTHLQWRHGWEAMSRRQLSERRNLPRDGILRHVSHFYTSYTMPQKKIAHCNSQH